MRKSKMLIVLCLLGSMSPQVLITKIANASGRTPANAPMVEYDFGAHLGKWRVFKGRFWQKVNTTPQGDQALNTIEELAQSRSTNFIATNTAGCGPDMVNVRGSFLNSSEVEAFQTRYCTDRVAANDRCLTYDRDQYSSHIAQLRQSLNSEHTIAQTTATNFCMDRYEFPNREGQYPMVSATWYDAEKNCESQGKRLCSPNEWTFACEGEEAQPYPYSQWERRLGPDEGGCVINQPADSDNDAICQQLQQSLNGSDRATSNLRVLLGRFAPSDIHYGQIIACLFKARPSGAVASCRSPMGVNDLTGNIDEWTATNGAQRALSEARRRLTRGRSGVQPETESTAVLSLDQISTAVRSFGRGNYPSWLKGGDWRAPRTRCRPATTAHGPGFAYYNIGFRCCRNAPSTTTQ